MNYYEHHLGDYLRDTAHLSMLEDAAYRRLLDAYYVRERPLPIDERECFKLARAQSKAEREAVSYVLREFFERRDDGYHQERADREIARYQEKQPQTQRKREGMAERQRRARERRKSLFDELRTLGVVSRYNASTAELVEMLSRATGALCHEPVTRDNTITHTPDTSYSVPIGTASGALAQPTPPPSAPTALPPALPVAQGSPEAGQSLSVDLSKAQVWRALVSLLETQGMPERQSRAFIGSLAKQLGEGADEALGELCRDAVAEQPADARAWLMAAAKSRSRHGGRRPSARSHAGLSTINYGQGVNADGTFV